MYRTLVTIGLIVIVSLIVLNSEVILVTAEFIVK